MTTKNQINSNFAEIATIDSGGNVTGVATGNLSAGSNVFVASPNNLKLQGGMIGEVLTVNPDYNANVSTIWNRPSVNYINSVPPGPSSLLIAAGAAAGESTLILNSPYLGASILQRGTQIQIPSVNSTFYQITDRYNNANLAVSGTVLETALSGSTGMLVSGINTFAVNDFVCIGAQTSDIVVITARATEGNNTRYNYRASAFGSTDSSLTIPEGTQVYLSSGTSTITVTPALTATISAGTSLVYPIYSSYTAVQTTTNLTGTVNSAGMLTLATTTTPSFVSVAANSITLPSTTTALTLGSNTANTVGTITFNTAGSTFNGMVIQTAGVERWFVGRDNTSAGGQFTINSNGVAVITAAPQSNNRTTLTVAGNVNANNIGATAVYNGVDSGNINGDRFPFALWDPNSTSPLNFNASDVGISIPGGGGDIWKNNVNQDIVLTVTYNLVTTGTFTPNIAAGYISVTNSGVVSNIALSPGTSFNSNNYYQGSATFRLVSNAGNVGGTFSVRLNVPGQNATGNITTASTMTVTRIR